MIIDSHAHVSLPIETYLDIMHAFKPIHPSKSVHVSLVIVTLLLPS